MDAKTLSIHGGFNCEDVTGATAVPIFQTVSYAYRTAQDIADAFEGKAPGYIYTRIANPTTRALEQRLTELEAGVGCIATSSGMAAIASVALALLRAGDRLVASSGIFGGTVSLFKNTLGRFGVETVFVETAKTEQYASAIDAKTKFIFLETIGNPKMDVPDIPAIAEIAHGMNIPLVLDSTLTTPFLIKGKDFGADIVVHSTSKFINGHGTAIGGAIVDTGNYDWGGGIFEDIKKLTGSAGKLSFLAFLRNVIYRDLGGCPAPLNSFLMLQGLETLGPRMEIHCSNALLLAGYLKKNPHVPWVHYPGLPESPYRSRVKKLFGGRAGGLLSFGLGDRLKAFRFINALRVAKNLANLGDAKTLVIHPSSTIFHEFSPSERLDMGVPEDMIRVSVGIEDFEDIKSDFEQAINQTLEVQ